MRFLDPLFAIRPLVLVPAWTFFLLGWGQVRDSTPFPALRLVLFTLAMIGVHLVNQVVDRDSDRINAKGFFLQRGIFSTRQYGIAAAGCLVASLGLAAWSAAAPGLLAAAVALGLAYSAPPLRLAARPGFDLLANVLGYGCLAPLLGAGDAMPRAASFVASTGLAVGAVFLHTTLLDLEGDRRTGKRTSGLALGQRPARALAALLAAGALAGGLLAGTLVMTLAGAALAAGCMASAVAPRRVSSRTICVGGTALYAVAAAAIWPPFLCAVLVLAAGTRIYYARRFGIRYPAL